MESRVTRESLFLFIGISFILLITSCAPVREDPEYGYGREKVEAVPVCKSALRDEVAFQWGRRPEIRFQATDKKAVSSRTVLVTGSGVAKDRKKPRPFAYRCEINIRTGRIAELELKWEEKAAGAGRKGLALCRSAVKTRVRRSYNNSARLEFGSSDSQYLSRHIEAITGTAKVHGPSGRGRIKYECEVNRRNDRLNHVDYSWINKPSGPPSARMGNSVALCHDAIREKAKRNGADRVRFSPPRIDRRSKHERIVHGDGKINLRKHWKNISYQCHVNVESARVHRSSYHLGADTTPAFRPKDELKEQCEKAVARRISKIESNLDVNLYALNFNPKKWKHLGNGKEQLRGNVRLGGDGHAKAYPFSCTVDIYSGKVTKTTLNYR